MFDSGKLEPGRLHELFVAIEPDLLRYPGVDADAFRAKVQELLSARGQQGHARQ